MTNHAEAFHGLDSHAFRSDTMQFGPVEPGKAMQVRKTVDTPGVFMYHCADGPSTDYHVKSGLAGAMIVYPRNRLLRGARELVIVESAVFGEPDASGEIPGTDSELTRKNEPSGSRICRQCRSRDISNSRDGNDPRHRHGRRISYT